MKNSALKRIFVVLPILVLLLAFGFGCRKPPSASPSNASNEPPPDVLSATNLAQWKSLIKDLRPTPGLRDSWSTSRFRRGSPPVLLRRDGQTIVYKAEAIEVTTLPRTTKFMEAQIYSPKLSVKDTRALSLSLCSMFGFESNTFSAWSEKAGTKWLDVPVFYSGDRHYSFNVRHSYNDDEPWFIIFTIQDEQALHELLIHHSK
jgi:hypothetical protein